MAVIFVIVSSPLLARNGPMSGPDEFVSVNGGRLSKDGKAYRFVGVNIWYGAYLAADAPLGDADRLRRELDLLQQLGVKNVRILGASEESALRDSIKPSFQTRDKPDNQALLRGLDILLVELRRRDMTAVIYLNNFWEWSGGMATYLSWVNGGTIVDPADPKTPWPAYPLFTKDFYSNDQANVIFRNYVRRLIERRNSVSGYLYRDDPTIMSWQLANEPRPGFSIQPGQSDLKGFYDWIDQTAKFIKSIDPNHLVSTGNEGFMGCVQYDPCFIRAHQTDNIDYLTMHIWPLNWGWIDPNKMAASSLGSIEKTHAYIDQHLAYAKTLDKPIVLEEFGFPRDGGQISPGTPTRYRDQFIKAVFGRIEADADANGHFAGSNFWAWGGFGRARDASGKWRSGDTSFVGDPPQEPQGRNSIFDADRTTVRLIQRHAKSLDRKSRQ